MSYTNFDNTDFLLEPLQFADMDPVEFERLIFYLMSEMGFKDIVWRKGGEGNSATDGGRDLEARYWNFTPLGTVEENYWIEVKYRKRQLEKSVVHDVILNSQANKNIDHLIIVTNSTISNPTLDWIKNFQEKHERPLITIWQGHDLELLLRENPRTLAQFFSKIIAFSGKSKSMISGFLNLFRLPSNQDLYELWQKKDLIIEKEDYLLLLAAVIAELSHGDINTRKWGIGFDPLTRATVFTLGLVNIFSFAYKLIDQGIPQEILIRALTYLLETMLVIDGAQVAFGFLWNPEKYYSERDESEKKHKIARIQPLIEYMFDELAVQCSKGCFKLHYRTEEEANVKPFMYRFIDEPETVEEKSSSFLVISSYDEKCSLDLIPQGESCYFILDDFEYTEENVYKALEFAEHVLRNRISEVRAEI